MVRVSKILRNFAMALNDEMRSSFSTSANIVCKTKNPPSLFELWRIEVLVELFVIPVTWSREKSWSDIDSDIFRERDIEWENIEILEYFY